MVYNEITVKRERLHWNPVSRVKRRIHMSRTQFSQLGSCEVRRLTQLNSTDFNWRGRSVLQAWPAVKNAWRPTLDQTPILTWAEPKA